MNAKDIMLARKLGGGGGSVPKPLTYDYMPEGYPTKTTGTVTVMEEQELAFTLSDGFYMAPITNAFEIVEGHTYTVNWDGTEYECVCFAFNSLPALGNLSIYGMGNDTGEPFIYVYNSNQAVAGFTTHDTSASHTISVKTIAEAITPIDEKYLPAIPADKLPAIPADKLPAIPADKLPAIPADKLEFPIIKISGSIQSTIAAPTQPTYDVTNLDNAGIIAAINAGIFAVQDDSNLYFPTFADVNANNDALINIVFRAAGRIYFAELCCNAGLTKFFRNSCYYIEATQLS